MDSVATNAGTGIEYPRDIGGLAGPKRSWVDRWRARFGSWLIGVSVVVSVLALLVTGNPVLALLPGATTLVLYLLWTQPLRRTLGVVTFATFFFFSPPYSSNEPVVTALLDPGSRIMNGLLNKVVNISLLSFSGTEFAFIVLFLILVTRELRGLDTDARGRIAGARVVISFLALELVAIIMLELWGAVSGGTPRVSLFQIRPFIELPLYTLVISYALRDSRDFKTPAILATIAAVVKIGIAVYLVWKNQWVAGKTPVYMTSHGDTVLFVCVIFVWFAAWAHEHSWKRLFGTLLLISWIVFGIVVNNRRIAWVSLVAAFFVFYTTVNGMLRRRVNLAMLFLSPIILTYLAIATKVDTGIFAPGAKLVGISNASDGSTQWRILEMQNLIYNFNLHKFFGAGFGKEWIEVVKLPDVSLAFKEYRLVGHNSVLWILGVSGIFGFMVVWMPIVVGMFLAARSYRFARSPADRTAAATVLAIGIVYVNQAWGDIGVAEPMGTLLLALALSLASKLAVETGAWSSRTGMLARSA